MANWEIVDKFTILKIKLEQGLNCEEQYFEYLKETSKIDKKLIKSEHARGIYFGELYENTREFLREEAKKS